MPPQLRKAQERVATSSARPDSNAESAAEFIGLRIAVKENFDNEGSHTMSPVRSPSEKSIRGKRLYSNLPPAHHPRPLANPGLATSGVGIHATTLTSGIGATGAFGHASTSNSLPSRRRFAGR